MPDRCRAAPPPARRRRCEGVAAAQRDAEAALATPRSGRQPRHRPVGRRDSLAPQRQRRRSAGAHAGISTERDEGEGKFVQIRGTEPRLSNVTINGAHVPGTETSSRVPKLDDVPSDSSARSKSRRRYRRHGRRRDRRLGQPRDASSRRRAARLHRDAVRPASQLDRAAGAGERDVRRPIRRGSRSSARCSVVRSTATTARSTTSSWRGASTASRRFPRVGSARLPLRSHALRGVRRLDYRFDDGSTIALRGLFSEFRNYDGTHCLPRCGRWRRFVGRGIRPERDRDRRDVRPRGLPSDAAREDVWGSR